MIDWMGSRRGTTAIFAVFLLTTLATPALLCPIVLKIVRRRHKARSGVLKVLHDPANAEFEFVNADFLAFAGSLLSMILVPIPNTPGLKQSPQFQPTESRISRPRHLNRDIILGGCLCCAIYYHTPFRKLDF